MKKHLLAAAVTAAFAVPAVAQVTVYGLIDAGYATSDISYGAGKSIKQKMVGGIHSGNGTGTLSGSRLGFRGSEDIGGGLKVDFVYEVGVNYSSGTAATSTAAASDATLGNSTLFAATRQGFLGLSGSFGTVRIGQQNSITKVTTESMDPGAGSSITGAASLYQLGLSTTRPDVITYMSPTFNGFQIMAQSDVGETTTSESIGKDSHSTSIGATFKSGPISVVASTESRKEVLYVSSATAGLVSLTSDSVNGPQGASNKTFDEVTQQTLGASYKLGMATVSVLSTQLKFKDATAADNGKIDNSLVGVTVPLGNLSLMLSLSQGSIEDNGTETFDTSAHQFIAQYNLSKRTNAYAAMGQTKFDSPTANKDVKIKQVGIGLRHSF